MLESPKRVLTVVIRGSLSSWLPIVRFLIFAIIVLLFIYVMIIVVDGRVAGLGAVGIHGGTARRATPRGGI